MSTRKVSYTQLLKEAMSDFDTSKTVDVTGPMTKQIISYKGDGELKTTSDAASILERYYFGDDNDSGVSILGEEESRTDFPEPDRNDIDDEPSDNISKTKKDIEDAVAEASDYDLSEADYGDDVTMDLLEDSILEESTTVGGGKSEDLSEAEEAVIEKLISEMEGEDEDEGGESDEGGEEETSEGYWLEQEDEGDEEEEDEELDADEETTQEMGPIGNPRNADELTEAFNIFREEIESDSIEEGDDLDSDNMRI